MLHGPLPTAYLFQHALQSYAPALMVFRLQCAHKGGWKGECCSQCNIGRKEAEIEVRLPFPEKGPKIAPADYLSSASLNLL